MAKKSVWVRVQEAEAVVESLIEKHGWVICGSDESDDGETPAHAYTLGLSRMGMAELIVVGLPHLIGGGLLSGLVEGQLAEAERAAHALPGPVVVENVVRKLYLLKVESEGLRRFAPEVAKRGGANAQALQLCWADSCGRFPWERLFDGGQWEQPVLGAVPSRAH